jgi:CubicO group peptidase (beta-lactamase class C family)
VIEEYHLMRALRRFPVIALIVVFFAARFVVAGELPTAKPGEVGLDGDKIQQAHDAVKALIDKKEMAGAVIAVARKGKIVMFEAQGEMEAGSGKPMTPDTIVRIFSMTKPITTVAAMMLVEEGKIRLDDPVAMYVPELKGLRVHAGKADSDETFEVTREPTVRDLMRHTAGLTYGAFSDGPVDRIYRARNVLSRDGTLRDMMEKLGKTPLMFQPGTRWHYSVATDVLGRVVEVAASKPLDEYFAERIFTPLDMKDTGFYVPADKLDRFAASHGLDKDKKLTATEPAGKSRYRNKPKLLSGGGGLVGTARDYLRFCQMLLNGGELDGVRILKRETIAEMTKNQLPEDAMKTRNQGKTDVGDGFGLGFNIRVGQDDPVAGRFVDEYAWGGAASTHFWIAPKQELVVVALEQFMPNRPMLKDAIKPLIYQAVKR